MRGVGIVAQAIHVYHGNFEIAGLGLNAFDAHAANDGFVDSGGRKSVRLIALPGPGAVIRRGDECGAQRRTAGVERGAIDISADVVFAEVLGHGWNQKYDRNLAMCRPTVWISLWLYQVSGYNNTEHACTSCYISSTEDDDVPADAGDVWDVEYYGDAMCGSSGLLRSSGGSFSFNVTGASTTGTLIGRALILRTAIR